MKRKAEDRGLDELICPKHRLPIRGICVDKHCAQYNRFICSSCKDAHQYDDSEYIDEILSWDYLSKHKFKRLIDTLEDRKSKRSHKMSEMERGITQSFDNLKISISTLIEQKRQELLALIKEEASRGSSKEVILLHKIFKLRNEYQKKLKKFSTENFLSTDLTGFIEKHRDFKLLETKFNEVQKQPIINLPNYLQSCSKIQQELVQEIPKYLQQFEKKENFRKFEKILFSFPKFTLNKEHIKVSSLECVKDVKETLHEMECELSGEELEHHDDELTFERLTLLQYDDSSDFLYTQSVSKKFMVLNGLRSKTGHFSYPINNSITCSVLSKETQEFYFGTQDGEVFSYDNVDKKIRKVYEFNIKISGIAIVPNNPTWLVVATKQTLSFLDSTKDPLLFKAYQLTQEISAISYNSVHNQFIIGSNNGKVSLWNLDKNFETAGIKVNSTKCTRQIVQSQNGKTAFTCDENGRLCFWKITQDSLKLLSCKKFFSPLLTPEILPLFSHNLLIIKEDWVLKIVNLATGRFVKKLHIGVYEDFQMLYDEKNAVLNLFKNP